MKPPQKRSPVCVPSKFLCVSTALAVWNLLEPAAYASSDLVLEEVSLESAEVVVVAVEPVSVESVGVEPVAVESAVLAGEAIAPPEVIAPEVSASEVVQFSEAQIAPVVAQVVAQIEEPEGGSPEFSPASGDPFWDSEVEASSLDPEDVQAEVGQIQVVRPPLQPPPRRQPVVQLQLRSSAFTSSNATASEIDPLSDVVFINSATLLATPSLGPETRLIAAATGGLGRFAEEDALNYNFLNFNVGIQQRLAAGTYGQIGWVQDRLYRQDGGDLSLLSNSIRLTLGRQEQLAERLRLDYFYELRARFADPETRSRVGNTVGARLRYDLTPELQAALDYRLTLDSYTKSDRFDAQHQVRAIATYNLNRNTFLSGSASYLFGTSTASTVNPENFSVGISLGVNLPLF